MKRETLTALNEARRTGRPVVRAIELATGNEQLVDPHSDTSALGLAAGKAARADSSEIADVDGSVWFLEVHNSPLDLVIVGAVHIAQPLSQIAALAGYGVRIVDPRTAFATAERFPGVALSHDWADDALAKKPLTPRSAIVLLTHDPKLDDPALIAALRSNSFYIGALGSKKTQAARKARMKEQGFDDAALSRIHGPIGLNIGARSPAEIAVAILGEITLALRGSKS